MAWLLLRKDAGMSKEINFKQADRNAINGEDFYAQAVATMIGVVAALLGGLFAA